MPWVRTVPPASVALLACFAASCARRSTPTDPLPGIAGTRATAPRLATMDSVRAIPLPSPGTPSRAEIRLSLREGRKDADRPPPLYVVGDAVLGRRSDGSVDRVAAAEALRRLDAKRIESIEVIRDATATNRFGPAGADGVVIFTMIGDTSSAVPKAP